MKLPERSDGNFFMFLKTNEGYLSQIALKNMQFLVNYTLHEPTFIASYRSLGLSSNFPKLVTHDINIVIVDLFEMVNSNCFRR